MELLKEKTVIFKKGLNYVEPHSLRTYFWADAVGMACCIAYCGLLSPLKRKLFMNFEMVENLALVTLNYLIVDVLS